MNIMTLLAATSAAALLHTAAFAQTAAQTLPNVDIDKPEPILMADADLMVEGKVNTFPKDTVILADVDAEDKLMVADAGTTPGVGDAVMHTVTLLDGTQVGEVETLIRDADGTMESVVVMVRGGVDEPLVPVEIDLTGAQVVDGELILALDEVEFMRMVAATENAG